MEIYEFKIIGQPVSKGRARVTKKGFAFTPIATKQAEENIRAQIIQQLPKGFMPIADRPIRMTVTFYMSRPKSRKMAVYHTTRPDGDNLQKAVLDAMNTVVFKDDALVFDQHIIKVYSDVPRTDIILEVIN